MRNKSSKLLLFLSLVPLLLNAVITRDDVISKAETYLNLNWSPSIDTCVIKDWQGNKIDGTFKSYYKKGHKYTWEAYVWGGVNTTSDFISRINSGYCAGGYNTSDYGYYHPGHPEEMSAASHFLAGLDCAAFANSCLSQPIGQGIDALKNRCIPINRSDVKKGDIWVITHHIRLAGEGNSIYESHANTNNPPPGVVYRPSSNVGYTPYSIFPQFSNPDISYNKDTMNISVDIAVNARYGRVHKDSVKVRVDGKEINDFTFKSLGNGRYRIKSSKGFVLSRDHILEIRADNEELRNRYRDTDTLKFIYKKLTTVPADSEWGVIAKPRIRIAYPAGVDTASVKFWIRGGRFSYKTYWEINSNSGVIGGGGNGLRGKILVIQAEGIVPYGVYKIHTMWTKGTHIYYYDFSFEVNRVLYLTAVNSIVKFAERSGSWSIVKTIYCPSAGVLYGITSGANGNIYVGNNKGSGSSIIPSIIEIDGMSGNVVKEFSIPVPFSIPADRNRISDKGMISIKDFINKVLFKGYDGLINVCIA